MDANPDVIMFGLMSSLRTGNMILDMAVCLVLPMFFGYLYKILRQAWASAKKYLDKKFRREYRRTIMFEKGMCRWQNLESQHKNIILVQAVRTYIGRVVKPEFARAEVKLQSIRSTAAGDEAATKIEKLEKHFQIVHVPQKGEKCEVEKGLFVFDEENVVEVEEETRRDNRDRPKRKIVNSLTFTTRSSGGNQIIDDFVKKAYTWYQEEVGRSEDKSRFMYQPLVVKRDPKAKEQKPKQYKRYKLSDDKTFDSLFFSEKKRVLKLLNHFQEKTGKYAIQGFAWKLGLLLHGPPGTGKTSLVKAIATLTGRHIISVPLSRISTNQELMDVMFDQVFPFTAAGGGGEKNGDDEEKEENENSGGANYKHRIDEVVFLLEDVDAASRVVHAREEDGEKPAKESSMVAALQASKVFSAGKQKSGCLSGSASKVITPSKSVTIIAAEAKSDSDGEDPKKKEKGAKKEKDEKGETKADKKEDEKKSKKSKKKDEEKGDSDDDEDGSGDDDDSGGDGDEGGRKRRKRRDGRSGEGKKSDKGAYDDKDKLDLAGLLNVLDGVVDAPGRILVMTSNHPEKLDPALIRPGRVNMQVYMGYLRCDEAVEMMSHYYPDLAPKEIDVFNKTWQTKDMRILGGLQVSPAEFEQMCAECPTVQNLISTLEKKGARRS